MQYHGCSPGIQRPLRNKLEATERYGDQSNHDIAVAYSTGKIIDDGK